jgi:hypothetical protein
VAFPGGCVQGRRLVIVFCERNGKNNKFRDVNFFFLSRLDKNEVAMIINLQIIHYPTIKQLRRDE